MEAGRCPAADPPHADHAVGCIAVRVEVAVAANATVVGSGDVRAHGLPQRGKTAMPPAAAQGPYERANLDVGGIVRQRGKRVRIAVESLAECRGELSSPRVLDGVYADCGKPAVPRPRMVHVVDSD